MFNQLILVFLFCVFALFIFHLQRKALLHDEGCNGKMKELSGSFVMPDILIYYID